MFNRIRRYSLRDKDGIRKLCLDNAEKQTGSDEELACILLMYCDYYIEKEPENCFVAVDDKDEVIGYCIASHNYDGYEEVFRQDYLPSLALHSMRAYVDAKMNMMSYAMYRSMYPAHFHMDIAEEYRRQGIGTKLLDVMKKDMLAKEVKGVMLVCGENNENAITFYEKYGFERKLKTKLGITYTLDFE